MPMALGALALRDGNYAAAEAQFRTVLEKRPSHVGAMNNLAYALAKQSRSGGAALAERANSLDPDRPVILDTWAVAMATEGQLGKALELQKRTVDRFPRIPSIRMTLAQLAAQNGDVSLAREQLDVIERQGGQDVPAAEIAALRTKLK